MAGMMEQAQTILRQAEQSFAKLIEEAARHQAYEEVTVLASLAVKLKKIAEETAGNGTEHSVPANEVEVEEEAEDLSNKEDFPVPQSKRAIKKLYPQFRRDGGNLVKIAWSRAFHRSYEHRADRRVIDAVTKRIADLGASKKMDFRVEDLTKGSDGKPLLKYQVYAVVSWLRWAGLITQHGRSGYSVPSAPRFLSSVEAAWNQLKEIRHQESVEEKNGSASA